MKTFQTWRLSYRLFFEDKLFVSGVHGFNKERASGFAGLLEHLNWSSATTLLWMIMPTISALQKKRG